MIQVVCDFCMTPVEEKGPHFLFTMTLKESPHDERFYAGHSHVECLPGLAVVQPMLGVVVGGGGGEAVPTEARDAPLPPTGFAGGGGGATGVGRYVQRPR